MTKVKFLPLLLFISILSCAQPKKVQIQKDLSDEQLLELVQKQTFRYFWDFADPVSGLSRERSNVADYGPEVSTIGGTGFGVMSIVVAADRNWITRETACERLLKMLRFLKKSDRFHGMFPHWMNGETGKTIAFSKNDNGADIVESAYLFQGLIAVKEYFDRSSRQEKEIRDLIDELWKDADWNWFTRGGEKVLYWHWSPDKQWTMNHRIEGYNECLITYVLAASSPTI